MLRCSSVEAHEASRMQHGEVVACVKERIMLRCSSVEAHEASSVEHGEIISLRLRVSVEIFRQLESKLHLIIHGNYQAQ